MYPFLLTLLIWSGRFPKESWHLSHNIAPYLSFGLATPFDCIFRSWV
jgi:hypothetical protein